MESLQVEKLTIKVKKENKEIYIKWLGLCEIRNPAVVLNPYFKELIQEVGECSLVVDFKLLEYMNSSTIIPIIQIIKELETNKIQTLIVYDKNSTWQQNSFKALEQVCKNLKNIKIGNE